MASAVSTPEPEPEPVDDAPIDDEPMIDSPEPSNDKPFDDTPFDAGVEADEKEDPKKFIEQLAGKIATTLRTFTKKEGQPDFDLEKYVINSVIAATHTSEMDEDDKKDIIKKINKAGLGTDNEENDSQSEEETVDDIKSTEEESIDENDTNWSPEAGKGMWGSDESFNNPTRAMWEEEEMEEPKHFNLDELMYENDGDETNPTRYMFFSNLEQIRRQADLLLDLDEGQIEAILNSGHDWAADHVATAKESFDQVFDFLMNETSGNDIDGEDDYSEWSKPMELQGDTEISEALKYHLENKLALGESVYRYGSEAFFSLIKEVKSLYDNNLIKINENDEFIINDFDSKVRVNGEILQLGQIMESEEETYELINENLEKRFKDLNKKYITLDKQMDDLTKKGEDTWKIEQELEEIQNEMSKISAEMEKQNLNEAEYKGKKVELNKPKRGGSKKFYVYVKNPKTGKVKKVSFGAKAGGGNLAVKLKDPKARKAFADRHNCEQKNDKTTPGYWSCRLPRYSKLLGLSGGGRFW